MSTNHLKWATYARRALHKQYDLLPFFCLLKFGIVT